MRARTKAELITIRAALLALTLSGSGALAPAQGARAGGAPAADWSAGREPARRSRLRDDRGYTIAASAA